MRTSKKRQRRRRTCDLGASGENIIGYCTLHKCCMSKKQMQNRKCLEKKCTRFSKRNEHPYWKGKEEKKALRKQRKEAQRSGDDLQAISTSEAGVWLLHGA